MKSLKFFFLNFLKLTGLWLVGEVVAIYGSKVAEGFSAFQRRSCKDNTVQQLSYLYDVIAIFGKMVFSAKNIYSAKFNFSVGFNSLRPSDAYMRQ